MDIEDLRAFLLDAAYRVQHDMTPALSIVFTVMAETQSYLDLVASATNLSNSERIRRTEASKSLVSQEASRKALERCITFLMTPRKFDRFGWGIGAEDCAEVLRSLLARSFEHGNHDFDIFRKEKEGRHAVVRLTKDQVSHLRSFESSKDQDPTDFSSNYAFMYLVPQVLECPHWFIYYIALPAILDLLIMKEARDPFDDSLPLRMSEWFVGPH